MVATIYFKAKGIIENFLPFLFIKWYTIPVLQRA